MKNINKFCTLLLGTALLSACSDFDKVNTDPKAASAEQIKVAYVFNNSLTGAQQNPDVAERAFVLTWKTGARQGYDTYNTSGISCGTYTDEWNNNYYNQSAEWQRHINLAISLANEKIESGALTGHELEMTKNIREVSRIWRVYLMSEFADCFGTIPLNAFSGENPEFASLKDVYYYFFEELKDAVAQLDLSVSPEDDEKKYDRAYSFNFTQWAKYANSMRLRLAMRLSEVDPEKAKTEFESAVKTDVILTVADRFEVKERDGWDPLAGVMSRQWNSQMLSTTLNNLMLGLGGIETKEILTEDRYQPMIKPENYIGVRYEKHFSLYTNDPSAGFWLDGLPNKIDPRAYKLFFPAADYDSDIYCNYPDYSVNPTINERDLLEDDNETVFKTIDARLTWNASSQGDQGEKGARNKVTAFVGTNPGLAMNFRDHSGSRVFFANWETYFLIAEAAVRGWSVPMSAKQAYESGVYASFEYNGLAHMADTYLASTAYNRVGTSVNFDHTAEPPASVEMEMIDGYTNARTTYTFRYPEAANTLYGKALNDQLTKIITQKYLAFMPWLPLEAWCDHRRLGLPFFEVPCVEQPLVNMPQLTKNNYMKAQVDFYPQRMRFPSSLENSNPDGYRQAVEILGGDDLFTTLWWAKKK